MHRVIPVDPTDPLGERLDEALVRLKAGGVVALPTETFYGLAVRSFDGAAAARVNRLKGKPEERSPMLLLLADGAQVATVCEKLPDLFETLAERFWPGPLTLIVPAGPRLPEEISAGLGTVAVRVPGLALPRRMAARLGEPITGPSANLHRQPPARTAGEVAAAFPTGVDLILDGGPAPGGASSTILDLTVTPPRIVREGQVPRLALTRFVPGMR
jgi:L-threonylcarbamoyladenylate synthase